MTIKITLWEDGYTNNVRVLYNTTRAKAQATANRMVASARRARPRHNHIYSLEVLFENR